MVDTEPISIVDADASAEELRNATSAVGQRRLVGYLGIALPLLCLAFTIGWRHSPLPSISHYYYTPVHGAFTAILCGLGMVLYVYRGYDQWDNVATNVAATAAFGVGLFPTFRGKVSGLPDLSKLFLDSEEVNGVVHNASAISLFLMFFFISGFLFTRNPPVAGRQPTFQEFVEAAKRTWLFARTPSNESGSPRERENALHRRCAWIILVSIVLVALFSLPIAPFYSSTRWPGMAVFETTAILSFAQSWLAKNKKQPNVVKLLAADVKRLATTVTHRGPG